MIGIGKLAWASKGEVRKSRCRSISYHSRTFKVRVYCKWRETASLAYHLVEGGDTSPAAEGSNKFINHCVTFKAQSDHTLRSAVFIAQSRNVSFLPGGCG